MTQPTANLFAGALDHLLHHRFTGCSQAAYHAAQLLARLAEQPDVDGRTRSLCEQMSDALAADAKMPGN